MVIDFAIEGDDYGAVFVAHRLRRCGGKIDNRETTVPKTDLAIGRYPGISAVRPAMDHGVPHAIKNSSIDRAGP